MIDVNEILLETLLRVRYADPEVCPFMNASQEFWYTTGMMAGFFRAGLITSAQYTALGQLAGNAFQIRNMELFK